MTCRTISYLGIFLCFFSLTGCYNLKGISIPPNANTFYIDQFQNNVSNAPPDIADRFSDDFRRDVSQNTRLQYDEDVPDLEFSGSVVNFNVQSVAPQRNSTSGQVQFGSSLNRLTIGVKVDFVDNEDQENNWSQNFSFFEDFENTENLEDKQDELIDDIFEQILQDIFTKAFTNW